MTLAKRFNGEIINSDALQMYEGLPIATNKPSLLERKAVPHHLLGCIPLREEPWVVSKFVHEANRIIEDVQARGRLPILVGGTHYYTQSLLFRESVLGEPGVPISCEEQEKKWPILGASTEDMLEELRMVDPRMACKLHPRDRRKIRRSLEIWLQTGKRASEIYETQQVEKSKTIQQDFEPWKPLATSDLGIELSSSLENNPLDIQDVFRFDTLFLWVHADSETLKIRLNSRVDRMMDDGLLKEVASMKALHLEQIAHGGLVDITKGIWIAIGYKEFEEYTVALERETHAVDLDKIKADAVEQLKAATRQYAKRQVRWIRLKLLHELRSIGLQGNLFLLDGSDLSKWPIDVEEKACDLAKAFLAKQKLPAPSTMSEAASAKLAEDVTRKSVVHTRICGTCDATLMTEIDWSQHLRSRKHRKLSKRSQQGSNRHFHDRQQPQLAETS